MEQVTRVESDFAVVGLLDALGTKGVLDRSTPDGIFNAWIERLNHLQRLCDKATQLQGCAHCSYASFSDTVILVIVPENASDLPVVLSAMGEILQEVVWASIKRGIFFRGAVSTGRFLKAETKMVGESLEEAASWYETADWMGVFATPSVRHLLEECSLDGNDMSHLFVPYSVPFKNGPSREMWAINWPAHAAFVAEKGGENAKLQLLSSFRLYSGSVPPSVADKYANTLTFANSVWDQPHK